MQGSSDAAFRFRLNNIDHYQIEPTSFDPPFPPPKGSKYPPKIPIIRIFGRTDTGQKVCAHVHGAFPYIYIEYPTEEIGLDPVNRDRWLRALRKSLDKALGARKGDEFQNKPIPKPYVANISLVKGIPFYGFYIGWRYYAKIYLLNPRDMPKLSQILLSGAILQNIFQPYEAHIQYLLQFMIDFNLYGCGFVDCKSVRFRHGVPDSDKIEEGHRWHTESIPAHWMLPEHEFPRQSYCSLEVDIHVQDIMNRKAVSPRMLHHDFVERTNPIPQDLKLLHSLAELWKDENSRRNSEDQLNMEGFVASTGNREINEPWGGEDEKWEKVDAMIEAERQRGDGWAPSFEDFVPREEPDPFVQTALQSVEDFFVFQDMESKDLHPDEDEDSRADVDVDLIGDMNNVEFSDSDDDMELVDADEEMFNKKEEEDEEEEGKLEGENEDKVNELENDPSSQSDEYSDLEESITRRILWPNGSDSHTPPQEGHGSTSSQGDYLGDPILLQLQIKDEFRQLEDGSMIMLTPGPRHVPSKRKHHPDTPVSEKRASKSNKIEEIGKFISISPINQSSSQLSVNSALSKVEATGIIEHLCMDDVLNRSPLQLPLDSSMTRVITLPLSQERPSQDSIKSRGLTANTAELVLTHEMVPPPAPSIISSTAVSITTNGEKKMPQNITLPNPEGNWHVRNFRPPRASDLVSIEDFGMPQVEYQEPYFSDEKDIPEVGFDYGGVTHKFNRRKTSNVPRYNTTEHNNSRLINEPFDQIFPNFRCWEISTRPPTRLEAIKWLEEKKRLKDLSYIRQERSEEPGSFSQIEGPTQQNKYGFKFSQNKKSKNISNESQSLSIMSLEVHVNTRGNLVPDPEKDPIVSIFWCLQSYDGFESNGIKDGYYVGILSMDENDKEKTEKAFRRHSHVEIKVEYTELDIVIELVDLVRALDPDILTGYEVHSSSWGYLIERAQKVWGMDLCDDLSRVRQLSHGRFGQELDPWGFNTGSAIKIPGRHLINIWRAMRGELNLLGYTMENVVFHLLHKRIPHYGYDTLTKWYQNGDPGSLATVLDYYIQRVQLNLEIIDQQELISRTSEQARILGVDFNSVFSRGSQFKVESLMFRIAKPENFMLISPSKRQVGSQNALECLPLVMEPSSNFYTSPVVVLDFQSLYPSIMIAYNHCYSTFVGRIDSWNGQDKMGFQVYKRTPRLLELCKDYINISPNGMMFIKPNIRKSLLAKMLAEILDTRVMVKNGMKRYKDDKQLYKLLNNRQLALKLIANVTYGYTSASFSGRMPCAEIADSIVQSGRETLEKAIDMINNNMTWGAEVVYGDTDSLFIHLKGKTKAQAFDIGEEIAAKVTAMNPEPIKLKFEKVYHPCVLLAKKRYVGFKYEHRDQQEPEFDAKGIETVRRDGNPAVQKMVEKSLKILFRSSDLSQVKSYVTRQWTKIMKGDISIQDFTIAKEVKLGNYAEGIAPPPAVRLALERMAKDPRNQPQYGERYPFVVVSGGPNARLIDKSVEVEVLLHNSDILCLDSEYYITKTLIPPLARIFNLVGADVASWYRKMPKVQRLLRTLKPRHGAEKRSARTMESFMTKSALVCAVCEEKAETRYHICQYCYNERDVAVFKLQTKLTRAEEWKNDLEKICWSCTGRPWGSEIACKSLDCPIYYSRARQTSLLAYEREEIEPHLATLADVNMEDLEW
ncbi:DNA polymerase zeta catalytic subunit [Morchella snyderi]|nr:DNA polymerase zeta catalytic subunit [Morchella snyderi]